MMARPDSWVARRSGFTQKSLWVVKDEEGPKGSRIWPSGKYVPGSREWPEDSIVKWTQGDGNLDGEDILVYLTAGMFFWFVVYPVGRLLSRIVLRRYHSRSSA